MGKKVIPIQPIKDTRQRQVTFSKRKSGIFKKAAELAILTGVDIVLEIGVNGRVYRFQSDEDYEKLRTMLDTWPLQGHPVTPRKLAREGKLKGIIDQDSDESHVISPMVEEEDTQSEPRATRSGRRIGLESTRRGSEEQQGGKTRSGRGSASESETTRHPSGFVPGQFPANTAGQIPMMFYNPYLPYPMMSGQNFPMPGFFPPQMMMGNEATAATGGGNVSMRRHMGQDTRSSKDLSSTNGGGGEGSIEDESSDPVNLTLNAAAQEQQRMMNQWVASNFPAGSLLSGDEYLRHEEYTTNPSPGAPLSAGGGIGMPSFYTSTGGTAMPSPGLSGPNINWPTNGTQRRGSQEQA